MRTFRILAAFMMAVVCVGLSSCSKDNTDDKSSEKVEVLIVGTWERNDTWSTSGASGTISGTSLTSYTFKSDKTYQLNEYYYKMDNGNDRVFSEDGTYTYYNDTKKLILTDGDGEQYPYTIIEVNSNTLTITDDDRVDTYTRQK